MHHIFSCLVCEETLVKCDFYTKSSCILLYYHLFIIGYYRYPGACMCGGLIIAIVLSVHNAVKVKLPYNLHNSTLY